MESAYYVDLQRTDESRTRAAVARPNLRFWAKPHGICILRGFWGLFKNAVENRTKNLQNFWGAGMPLWYYRGEGSAG
ncbi:hypothetical protein BDA96_01G277100 [Sorghum bicolor]|uniref:Uncharacterized protein n=1 Tax=Sorghum bicolor TaxID=4558 RepID=A0A921S168_SORBI|nr:hypothetical protein BDA96_01G277100 [Sorghum bicolor]